MVSDTCPVRAMVMCTVCILTDIFMSMAMFTSLHVLRLYVCVCVFVYAYVVCLSLCLCYLSVCLCVIFLRSRLSP